MGKSRAVAISGVGQTYHRAHRRDVNQTELIAEAVEDCLADSGIDLQDIPCIVHGNMELFEGNHQPDMWHVLGDGGAGKAGFRITTGGSTGASLAAAADHLVASGLYDMVLAVGWEKHEEGNTTAGITNMADPHWGREIQTGAISGTTGSRYVKEFGERAELAAALLRVQAAENARRNPKAHLRLELTVEQVLNSPVLAYPLRLLHMCPQSNGACAVLFTAEDTAKRLPRSPVWVQDHVTVHREEIVDEDEPRSGPSTMEVAARRIYERNGIQQPLEEIDVFEMYDPSTWWALNWLKLFFFLPPGENLNMVEKGTTALDGSLPLNPSGGVVSTNPIGATALIRVAEAALQVRGDAGNHQVPRRVRKALASGFGGTYWTVLFLLSQSL